jgi:peptide/nickel transport system permease protein
MTTATTHAARVRTHRSIPPPTVLVAAVVLAVIVVAALFPTLFAPGDPAQNQLAVTLRPPSAEFWFGTDQLGRDVFTRVVHGARESLMMGLGATILAVLLGTIIGVISAVVPRWLDTIIMRCVDILLAFPNLLLALLVITVAGTFLGRGTLTVMIAIGLGGFAGYARVVRSQALVVRRSGYVEAAVAMGVGAQRLVWRHIAPGALRPLLVLATINIGVSIIFSSGLSFLGMGPQAPSPEWGLTLADGRNLLGVAWWVSFFPGLAITATVITVTVLGRYLRTRSRGELTG